MTFQPRGAVREVDGYSMECGSVAPIELRKPYFCMWSLKMDEVVGCRYALIGQNPPLGATYRHGSRR